MDSSAEGIRAQELLAQSVAPAAVSNDGRFTRPRTWGVYELKRQGGGKHSHSFRFGNHPVRQLELERHFGGARLIALFYARNQARELAAILNLGQR